MKESFFARVQLPLLIISEFISSYKIIKNEKCGWHEEMWNKNANECGIIEKGKWKVNGEN